MRGLMMDSPLTLTHLLERAARLYPTKEIVSGMPSGMHKYTYSDFHARVHRIAHALARIRLQPGERVASLCWNSYRHLELYFAIPCYGAVLHTLNLRLGPEQLAWIINHAEDRVIFVDASLFPLLERIQEQIPCVRHIFVLDDAPVPEACFDYEQWIAGSPDTPFEWPRLDENSASVMCYTSGTTGHPKGVVYTHRAIVLHSYGLCMADTFALSERDVVLQIVPMFHANGWGIPFAAVMTGSRLVFTGRDCQPSNIARLIHDERVTFSAGVPTIWMTLYSYLENHSYDILSLRLIVCAGSALPRQFIENYARKYGTRFMLAWGMTETTPIATVMSVKGHLEGLPDRERFDLLARHGIPVAGIDVRIVDENGEESPWDGTTMGELQTRGAWVTSGYYNDSREECFMDGWFRTGDVATIDAEGYIQIMDRTKDLVKSGGEWISSVDLENALMAHANVVEAAVIAIPHPKWQERPLACVVLREGCTATKEELLDFLQDRVPKWWLPDDVVFIDAVPKTSVGKFNKRVLRERFEGYEATT